MYITDALKRLPKCESLNVDSNKLKTRVSIFLLHWDKEYKEQGFAESASQDIHAVFDDYITYLLETQNTFLIEECRDIMAFVLAVPKYSDQGVFKPSEFGNFLIKNEFQSEQYSRLYRAAKNLGPDIKIQVARDDDLRKIEWLKLCPGEVLRFDRCLNSHESLAQGIEYYQAKGYTTKNLCLINGLVCDGVTYALFGYPKNFCQYAYILNRIGAQNCKHPYDRFVRHSGDTIIRGLKWIKRIDPGFKYENPRLEAIMRKNPKLEHLNGSKATITRIN